ncbi:Mpv17/PMP22 [Trypanosoma melophagium]|uniref:Mpv17/PMP22 n=1 Tax=Trypanosoma melophagium TaxID=715481 RepID=UPI00351A5A9F|nr:Mpv17/PMP22 [Trypanosoma melophagium]
MVLRRFYHNLSFSLRRYPWCSNAVIGTSIGFSADVMVQCVFGRSPPNTDSPLVIKCPRVVHFLIAKVKGVDDAPVAWIDLRRSFIFSSFTVVFNTYFFLSVYRRLDILFPPATVTRRISLVKGFMSWIAANLTTPLYLFYVTVLSHYFINHTGRRCVDVIEGGKVGWVLDYPCFCDEVGKQLRRQLRKDWPDMVLYSLAFWSVNWMPMFYYLPPHFRYVYGSLLQVVWSFIMSHLMHRNVKAN